MTEIFNELSVIGDPISEEDRVVYLLASLPDSYNTLVTALKANQDVPQAKSEGQTEDETESTQGGPICYSSCNQLNSWVVDSGATVICATTKCCSVS